ncbi:MAG: hypothetical protein ACOX9E_15885, partial [Lentisphaeria bacterium]
WRNPREAPTRNSTLKACHIANTKDDFHCKATENGQLSMGDRLAKSGSVRAAVVCFAMISLYILALYLRA